MSDITLL